MSEPGDLFFAILIGYADQQHEARSDLLRFEGGVDGAQFVDNVNAGLAHSLHYYFHNPHLTARSAKNLTARINSFYILLLLKVTLSYE